MCTHTHPFLSTSLLLPNLASCMNEQPTTAPENEQQEQAAPLVCMHCSNAPPLCPVASCGCLFCFNLVVCSVVACLFVCLFLFTLCRLSPLISSRRPRTCLKILCQSEPNVAAAVCVCACVCVCVCACCFCNAGGYSALTLLIGCTSCCLPVCICALFPSSSSLSLSLSTSLDLSLDLFPGALRCQACARGPEDYVPHCARQIKH